MSSLELRVETFVCKSYLKQMNEYYKNEYQKCLGRDLECSQEHFCVLFQT